MKLENTLEEIILQNKSLTEEKYKIARDYFKIRIQNTKDIEKLKISFNNEKAILVKSLKKIKNISVQVIDYNISYFKNEVLAKPKYNKSKTIEEVADIAFNAMIARFEYKCSHYYENNKEEIINYMLHCYKAIKTCKEKAKELSNRLNEFKNINSSINFTVLNLTYNELVSIIKIYKNKNICSNINDLNNILLQRKDYNNIMNEILLTEIIEVDKNNIKNQQIEQNVIDKNLKIKQEIASEKSVKIQESESTKEIKNNVISVLKAFFPNSDAELIVETSILNDPEIQKSLKKLDEIEARLEAKSDKKEYTDIEKNIMKINKQNSLKAVKNMSKAGAFG